MIGENIKTFAGLPVREYSADQAVPSPEKYAIRISLGWEMYEEENLTFTKLFASLIDDPSCAQVQALVVGDWGGAGQGDGSAPVVEALVSARDALPALRALFLGEMTSEESEISWINQSDVSPLFEAFPQLQELWIRGGNDLALGNPRHECLRKLVIQTGGLSASVLHDVASASLPQLEHLELWLGDDGYGNDIQIHDIEPLLTSCPFPKLGYLGFCDDCNADETAKLIARVGLPPTVQVLDLSLGTLSDEGAQALVESPCLKQLRKIDFHYHFVSAAFVDRLKQLVPEIDASDVQKADYWDGQPHRYVAVGE